MRLLLASLFYIAALLVPASAQAGEYAHVQPVKRYLASYVAPWLSSELIQNAIKKQNVKNSGLTRKQILKLDRQWIAEVENSDRPLIDEVLANKVSRFLTKKKREADGVITEVFIMDAKGLSVGSSNVTSDYWHGDERKWSKSYLAGPDAIFVDRIERDDSTQTFQAQVSMSIKDEHGRAIGAITLGINLDAL